ncbi:MAG: hypothetical protein F6K26_22335 [Moorea sp. SIO2I5]|nr:hypothetical protein [Moorena sp. SIO2I5]
MAFGHATRTTFNLKPSTFPTPSTKGEQVVTFTIQPTVFTIQRATFTI